MPTTAGPTVRATRTAGVFLASEIRAELSGLLVAASVTFEVGVTVTVFSSVVLFSLLMVGSSPPVNPVKSLQPLNVNAAAIAAAQIIFVIFFAFMFIASVVIVIFAPPIVN
jgi:hypothetical protein